MSKQRISPFLSSPPFSPTLVFLEKYLIPHPYCQIKGSQFPLYKGAGVGFELCWVKLL